MFGRRPPSSAPVMAFAPKVLRLRLTGDSFEPSRLLSALPALASRPISLEISSQNGEVRFSVWTPSQRLHQAGSLLAACFPGIDVAVGEAQTIEPPIVGWRLGTSLVDAMPLVLSGDKNFDFPTALVNLFARAETIDVAFQVVVGTYASEAWRRQALRHARQLTEADPGFFDSVFGLIARPRARAPMRVPNWLHAYQEQAFARAESQVLYRASVRLVAAGKPGSAVRGLAMDALRLTASAFSEGPNRPEPMPVRSGEELAAEFNARALSSGIVMSAGEVAVLWHPPRQLKDVPSLLPSARVVPSPREARTGVHRLGRDSEGRPVYLERQDRRSHLLVLGRNGTGKSTLVIGEVLADIEAGEGVAFVDMKGDAVQNILERFPRNRIADLVVIDPAVEGAVGFNPLRRRPGASAQRVADEVVVALSRLFETWGPRLERVLWHGLVAIQALPEATLFDLHTFLVDGEFRRRVLAGGDDEFVLQFWRDEFEPLSAGSKRQRIEPVLTRLQPFLANPLVRRVVACGAGIDFRSLMDSQKVVLADLAQGKLGQGNSAVLANLFTTSLQLAAMSRADMPEGERRDFYLFVDEAQVAAPKTFVKMLSEARAFRLSVSLITQFLHQFPEELVQALIGNAGTVIAFRIGEQDARLLVERFRPEFDLADLVNQNNYVAAIRTLANGQVLRPFTLFTDPLSEGAGSEWADAARSESRRRFGTTGGTASPPTWAPEPDSRTESAGWEWE